MKNKIQIHLSQNNKKVLQYLGYQNGNLKGLQFDSPRESAQNPRYIKALNMLYYYFINNFHRLNSIK